LVICWHGPYRDGVGDFVECRLGFDIDIRDRRHRSQGESRPPPPPLAFDRRWALLSCDPGADRKIKSIASSSAHNFVSLIFFSICAPNSSSPTRSIIQMLLVAQ